MSKGNFHGAFDPVVFESFQKVVGKGNVTKKLQDFMNNFNAQYTQNVNDINIELLSIEINTLRNQKIKIEATLQTKETLMQQIKDKQELEYKTNLENEKKRIENAKKCVICGFIRADAVKMHKFPLGQICQTCYMEKRDTQRWFKNEL